MYIICTYIRVHVMHRVLKLSRPYEMPDILPRHSCKQTHEYFQTSEATIVYNKQLLRILSCLLLI